MKTRRLTVAQALVRFLANQHTERDGEQRRLIAGCWGIFGHGNVAGIGQALLEAGGDMPYLQGRNEQAMVHAAVGFARQSNRMSTYACTTSIGPGATNLVTGAALATINHLPVLLLPGDIFATRPADPVLQQLEVPHARDVSVNDCLRPVSRYFDRIWRPEALIPSALDAMRVLTDPVETGAVTLALPQDVQAEAYDWPEEFFAERVWRVHRPAPDARSVAEAAERIRAAKRPLVIAGGGVHHSGAEEALRAFAESTGIPVSETQAGRGSLRFDHPCELGSIGHTGTAVSDDIARAADLIIGVGTRYSDFTTASRTLFANPDVRFVNVNITSLDAHKQAATPVIGDARTTLGQLTEVLSGHRVSEDYVQEYRAGAQRWAQVIERTTRSAAGDERPGQAEVLGVLDEVLDDRDVVINAAGSMPEDLNKLWRAKQPRQYHVEYGFSCMGYEIPAAIGARLADPSREVFALVGDGTYLMMPTELVTAVQEGIKINLVLVQNHGYASIGGLSEKVGGERFGTAYRYRDETGAFTGEPLPVDLAANAESLGMDVLRASTVDQMRNALRAARAAEHPTAVYVETDPAKAQLPPEAWWDVPVAEVSTRESTQLARKRYEDQARTQRHHL
ncbi:3D-(3,5/4)-trihydroxycyclohexane-1,2-dione acylhydrolase (decyclizing) [Saccharopolyspora phatthalungensis]|uniref:3D-(3,5/4)-trihydroxycyclohexane-1,2-dione acylhydrolase (Decyclizing) n=1 Tax=Saccharopolyspora phatthalungensis TaxID=664693 RepID=A0A840QJB5_9PSEU|nr:3D-(3,5/4)-trihydroxycyclohexane-1,2-dione acylhydrolase (decyclizing) [Saccharopolyspora phatthalungensis]MBB5159208.1 3D-(3,5/4)-trihydroxycyclohexane-1,2-dione acylhydrolase (decyclizing) [Saccharopolyspora phatthalungensis]